MSLLQGKFDQREGWAVDGIYFPDGRVLHLSFTENGIVQRDSTTIEILTDGSEDDDWMYLEEYVRVEAKGYIITGGATSWEGDGWVALQNSGSGELLWLIKLSDCEPVRSLAFVGDTIQAGSYGYPFYTRWQIPIGKPEKMHLDTPQRVDSRLRSDSNETDHNETE